MVLSTLHTNSATGTVPRLLDMGAEPFLLVSTIEVIVAQRLVRKLIEPKEGYQLTQAEIDQLAGKADLVKVLACLKEEKIVPEDATWPTLTFYRPKPTPDGGEGYSGRRGILEVLTMSHALREMVIKNETAEALNAQARQEGMLTMFEDGLFKAAQGITSIEEVLRAVTE
ncbi:hypothetical protein BK006_00625 [bacterium CG10_49_38]|nr:MAG: hypothetical protein BK006_00625 [bacterium CG10_49_38]